MGLLLPAETGNLNSLLCIFQPPTKKLRFKMTKKECRKKYCYWMKREITSFPALSTLNLLNEDAKITARIKKAKS